MRKMTLPLFLSIIVLLSACGAQTSSDNESATSDANGATLSSFTAIDLEGNAVDGSIFEDYDLTMINIWATFCSPCLNELPELGELADEYADKKVRIVGIVADVPQEADGSFDADMLKKAKDIVSETGADYLQLLPSEDLQKAKIDEVSAVPETIFVDSDGNIVGDSYLGARSGSEWADIIDGLLSQLQTD